MKQFISSTKILHPISLVVTLIALGSTMLRAADYTWTNGITANWTTTNGWSPIAPANGPTSSDNVVGTSGNNLQLNFTTHNINNFTATTPTAASWALQTGQTAPTTLNVAGTFTMDSAKSVFVMRNSGATTATLTLNAANISVVNTTGTFFLGNTSEATSLHAVSVSGATTVNAGAKLYMNVTNSANLGALTANGQVALVTTTNNDISRTVTVASLAGSGIVNGNVSSGLNSSANLIINGSASNTFSGIIGNGLNNSVVSLTKSGAGVQRLTGINTYTGATTVSSGTLLVDTGASVAASTSIVNGGLLKVNGISGGVTVNSGGSLGGSGTVGAVTLANGSFLKPGNSPGLLTASSATWAAGSTYQWEIDNATGVAGTNWDLFSVTGALNMSDLTSSSKMNLVLESLSLANYSTTAPFSWVIAKAGSFTGISAGVQDLTSLFNINSAAFNGGSVANLPNGGFQVVTGTEGSLRTLNLVAIPEPSTHTLLLLAFTGLGVHVMSRHRRS